MKIIGVGLPKTGTTSLGDACETLSFSRLRWNPEIHGQMTIKSHEGNYTLMRNQIDRVDVVEDLPFCCHYRWIAENYPCARFVLTKRSSPDVWLRSLANHLNEIPRWVGVYLTFGCYEVAGNKERLLKLYNDHNAGVVHYFAEIKRPLLVLTMGEENNLERLAEFVGVDAPENVLFPNSNKANYK